MLSSDNESVGDQRLKRIEEGFSRFDRTGGGDGHPLTLSELMATYRVPGLSLAVIDQFRVSATRGYGVLEVGSDRRVSPRTLFQAGSISKPVAAATALRLVEQGRLSLDEPVNSSLSSWKLPENEFTEREPVNLRRLLSHTAGLTVHGFPGHARDGAIPTLVQVLEGVPPANTERIRVVRVPGSEWRYSGGGYLVAQQLMMDVTGRSFPDLTKALVLDPLGMRDSSYAQPLVPSWIDASAGGTRMGGGVVPGRWHVYPEMAAAGLWTTAPDLAQFAVRVALARRGEDEGWMSQRTAEKMITSQAGPTTEPMFGDAEVPDRMGLGFFVGGPGRSDRFGHIGTNEGFQALLEMSSETGQGVAIMTNSSIGILVGLLLRSQVAREYRWKVPDAGGLIDAEGVTSWYLAARSKGAPAALALYDGAKSKGSVDPLRYRESLISLGYLLAFDGRLQDSVAVLERCVQENPEYWNAHDSLGEAYAFLGDRTSAIASYARSVELNPENVQGKAKLRELTSGT